MQTAISIPEPLFTQADQLALRLGLTRNELYLRAVAAFVAALNEDSVTEQLNQVYATEESAVDPVLSKLQSLSLPQEEWEWCAVVSGGLNYQSQVDQNQVFAVQ